MNYKYQFTPTLDGLVLEIVEVKSVSPMLSQDRVMFQTGILTSHEDVELALKDTRRVIELLVEDTEIVDAINGAPMSDFIDYLKSFSAPNNPWQWQHQDGSPNVSVHPGIDPYLREGWAKRQEESKIPF